MTLDFAKYAAAAIGLVIGTIIGLLVIYWLELKR